MTDTKRDYLYNFNRKLRDINSADSSIVSVFKNIDNDSLTLSPAQISNYDFVNKIDKCIFVIKRIVAMPYKTIAGKQVVYPVSQAQKVNAESVKLTLSDQSLWSVDENGKRFPKFAYSLTNDDTVLNYENAFMYHFIEALIIRLKGIKADFAKTRGIGVENTEISAENKEFYDLVTKHINKLMRILKEPVFSSNSDRAVDLSNIYLTDTLKSDKRYNFCYRFYCMEFKSNKKRTTVTTDFRVLYHNFALMQILYRFYKNGYTVNEDEQYQISVSGKVFIDSIDFKKDDKIVTVSRSRNGVDLASNGQLYHVEFSKSFILDTGNVNDDCVSKATRLKESGLYKDVYVAYLSSDKNIADNVLAIGYNSSEGAINKLIEAI